MLAFLQVFGGWPRRVAKLRDAETRGLHFPETSEALWSAERRSETCAVVGDFEQGGKVTERSIEGGDLGRAVQTQVGVRSTRTVDSCCATCLHLTADNVGDVRHCTTWDKSVVGAPVCRANECAYNLNGEATGALSVARRSKPSTDMLTTERRAPVNHIQACRPESFKNACRSIAPDVVAQSQRWYFCLLLTTRRAM